jgi:hypothetical protein
MLGRTPQAAFQRLREALESQALSGGLDGLAQAPSSSTLQVGNLLADYVIDRTRRELTVVIIRWGVREE